MDAVPYLGLALFFAVAWWTTLEKVRIGMYVTFFRTTEEQARRNVMRPAYRAGLWAFRVLLAVLAAGLLPLIYLQMHDRTGYAFLASVVVGFAAWGYFYWCLSRRG